MFITGARNEMEWPNIQMLLKITFHHQADREKSEKERERALIMDWFCRLKIRIYLLMVNIRIYISACALW